MKKLLTLLLLLIALSSGVCFAYDGPDPSRWVYVGQSVDACRFWYDQQSLTFYQKPEGMVGSVWVTIYCDAKDKKYLECMNFVIGKRLLNYASIVHYDKKGRQSVTNRAPFLYRPIIPDSVAESIYNIMLTLYNSGHYAVK